MPPTPAFKEKRERERGGGRGGEERSYSCEGALIQCTPRVQTCAEGWGSHWRWGLDPGELAVEMEGMQGLFLFTLPSPAYFDKGKLVIRTIKVSTHFPFQLKRNSAHVRKWVRASLMPLPYVHPFPREQQLKPHPPHPALFLPSRSSLSWMCSAPGSAQPHEVARFVCHLVCSIVFPILTQAFYSLLIFPLVSCPYACCIWFPILCFVVNPLLVWEFLQLTLTSF